MRLTRRNVLKIGIGAAIPASLTVRTPLVSQARQVTPVVDTRYRPIVDPINFLPDVDNPYLPLVRGTVLTYAGLVDGQPRRETVTVLADTRLIVGVTCTELRSQIFVNDEVVADRIDWLGQDLLGRVWYFAAATVTDSSGSIVTIDIWKTGADLALPGIAMFVDPATGNPYRQNYLPGVAEDMAQVIQVGGEVTVPFGSFSETVTTSNWSALNPDLKERRTYAPGIGLVARNSVSGISSDFSLIDVRTGNT